MTLAAFSLARDDFENNVIDPLWSASTTGSATAAETGGQARFTLPSSTAGSHDARYTSTGTYDLTSDSAFITIGTMVATGVAATAFFQLADSNIAGNALQWVQASNTLKAQTVVAGVATDRYSVAWSAATYKYLRIRESGGTTFFDSSTNGTSWTNRASLSNPIAVTSLAAVIGAACGNVASPGSFRLDEFNIILPAPSSTWRETTADWQITNRLRPITLAATANAQGVIVTADTMDETTRVLGGALHYFAGPLGSSSGGYLALTEYASLVLAQASAFPIPVDGRVDLPSLIDARYCRLYHRSTDASSHTLREFVPRRIVQADDIEAESIKAINISAGAITADKISVVQLSAITANIGGLVIDTTGYLWQGTGTAGSPTTGLKIYNSGGVGKLSTYNSGTEQVTIDTDGKMYAGGRSIWLDQLGLNLSGESSFVAPGAHTKNTIRFDAASTTPGIIWGYVNGSTDSAVIIETSDAVGVGTAAKIRLMHRTITNAIRAELRIDGTGVFLSGTAGGLSVGTATAAGSGNVLANGDLSASGGLNVGTASGAGAGQIITSGTITAAPTDAATAATASALLLYHRSSGTPAANYGVDLFMGMDSASVADRSGLLIRTLWATATDASRKARSDFHTFDTTNRLALRLEASGSAAMIGFLGAAAIVRPTVTGSKAANAALASVLTALANLGLIVDSST